MRPSATSEWVRAFVDAAEDAVGKVGEPAALQEHARRLTDRHPEAKVVDRTLDDRKVGGVAGTKRWTLPVPLPHTLGLRPHTLVG